MLKLPLPFLLILCLFFSLSENELFAQKNQKDWFAPTNRTNYLISPSALGLKKGEAYYQNIYGVYNSVAYGFTDHLTVKAGIFIMPILNLTLNPKLTFPIEENLHIGVASSSFFLATNDDIEGTSSIYGIGTYGNSNNNVSAGFGFGFDQSGLGAVPMFSFSGQKRISKNISLVSDNLIFAAKNNFAMLSLGCRLMGKKMSFDLALLSIHTEEFDLFSEPPSNIKLVWYHLPFISFIRPFGKR